MPKILIVGPASPYRGGISDLNEAFAKSLVNQGHEVEIISFKLQYPNFLFPGKTQFRSSSDLPTGYKIISLINSINPFSWINTVKYIIQEKPSKVFIRFWMPFFAPCLGYIAKKVSNKEIPVYSIVDNAIPHEKRVGDQLLANYFLSNCNKHFTLSNKVKEDILSLNISREVVTLFHPIYNTFDPKPSKENALNKLSLNKSKYILFFGLIRSYKGLALLLEAMSHPKIKEQNIKLIVAGEFYDDPKIYQSIINELNLNNIIIINDFIPKADVPLYFSVCNVVVLPYTSATQSGVTQLSMNYECPMVVTNVGGLPEVVDHKVNGLVVDPTPKSIADGILFYFSDESIENKMRISMRDKKKEYSWSNFTQLIIENTN